MENKKKKMIIEKSEITHYKDNKKLFYNGYCWMKQKQNYYICWGCFHFKQSEIPIIKKKDGDMIFNGKSHQKECIKFTNILKKYNAFSLKFNEEIKCFKNIISDFKLKIKDLNDKKEKEKMIEEIEEIIKKNEEIVLFITPKKKIIQDHYQKMIKIIEEMKILNIN